MLYTSLNCNDMLDKQVIITVFYSFNYNDTNTIIIHKI